MHQATLYFPAGFELQCIDGSYSPSAATLLDELQLTCSPVCLEACQNGGQCVNPHYCSCPQPWVGAGCDLNLDQPCLEDVEEYHMNNGVVIQK